MTKESNAPADPIIAALTRQYAGAMEMLRQSLVKCPDDLWDWREEGTPVWHHAYHTLWFLDGYLCKSRGLPHEMPAFHVPHGESLRQMPPVVLSRKQIQTYFRTVRTRCRKLIEALTIESLAEPTLFPWHGRTFGDTLIYNIRHIQHHTAQINHTLRHRAGIGMDWIGFRE